MTRLDCESPTGRIWIARQALLAERCAAAWGVDILETPVACPVDALLTRAGRLVGVAELKTRAMGRVELRAHGSYLVSFAKLTDGRALGVGLQVPYLLIVGLDDGTDLYWHVSDADGEWCAPMRIERTTTQATCNGGAVERMNAYLVNGAARKTARVPEFLR